MCSFLVSKQLMDACSGDPVAALALSFFIVEETKRKDDPEALRDDVVSCYHEAVVERGLSGLGRARQVWKAVRRLEAAGLLRVQEIRSQKYVFVETAKVLGRVADPVPAGEVGQ